MRPGFVHEVDESTPPLLIHQGHRAHRQRFPHGTKVVYPPIEPELLPEPMDELAGQLAAPLDAAPLAEQLRPGMKLTITFSVGGPRQHSDPRARVIEQVLTMAAEAGVDDVELIAANGLQHKLSEGDLHHVVGERVVRSFLGRGALRSHDAEDREQLVELARTDRDEPIEVNRRVAESDLVIHVGLVDQQGNDTWNQITTGLTSTATIDAQRGLAGVRDGGVGARMATALTGVLPVFAVQVITAEEPFGPNLGFLAKREWEWTISDRLAWAGFDKLLRVASGQVRRGAYQAVGQRGIVAIHAGDPGAVANAGAEVLRRMHTVSAPAPADVLVVGVAPNTAHNHDQAVDPLIANWSVLADSFGAHTGTPALRPGGVVLAFHALTPRFHANRDAAAADFFTQLLPADDDEIAAAQERWATDEWYLHLYRNQRGNHGLHPFHLWYATAAARELLGEVIWVGGDRDSAAKLGARAATRLSDALEIGAARVGADPSITYLHSPPRLVADVAGGQA
ncbi:lactate racemase domain-containing protein [Enemella sp. A6]|uniref:lactate racemase domain-containing protein n=1 Tax=Enemella sp. A6 TaxID=3440152 RepID=UPI003EBB3B23